MTELSRRQFHKGLLAGAGATLMSGSGIALAQASPAPRFTLAATSWSFHRALFSGQMAVTALPAMLAGMGIDRIEWTAKTLRPLGGDTGTMFRAPPASHFRELRAAADDAGTSSEVLNVGGPFTLASTDPAARQRAMDFVESYAEGAQALGCSILRSELYVDVPQGPDRNRIARDLAVESLSELLERLEGSGLTLNVENHHGLSSHPEWLASVLTGVDSERLGLTVDTNNFRVDVDMPYNSARFKDRLPVHVDRYEGMRVLMPFANWVSAKTYAFDYDGWEISMDYPRIMQIISDSLYRGTISVEYEGQGDPAAEVERSAVMLRRLFDHFA